MKSYIAVASPVLTYVTNNKCVINCDAINLVDAESDKLVCMKQSQEALGGTM